MNSSIRSAPFRDGKPDLLNLILEVSGPQKKDKAAKVSTAKTLRVPAVNNHGGLGRWAFLEIDDVWNAANAIHSFLRAVSV
jgi:type III restriction enzyme